MPPDCSYSCCFPSHFRILYTLVGIVSHSSQISNHLIFYSRYYFLTFCISKLCFKYLLGIATHWKGDNWGLLIFVKNSQRMPPVNCVYYQVVVSDEKRKYIHLHKILNSYSPAFIEIQNLCIHNTIPSGQMKAFPIFCLLEPRNKVWSG